jgi:L-ascorbate metabolism protein UlaG (beta-lactamase superfamily)
VDDVKPSVPPQAVETGVRFTLVNHSTILVQLPGCNILTDPVWSERASPFSWAGPRRHRKPGIAFDDLPPIDAVLISHNHYDHLDLPTVRRLARAGPAFVVPNGVGRLLHVESIEPVVELDWGESAPLPGAMVHAVPALHFSSRGVLDRNRTLWCGYVIQTAERVIYFAADTGFGWHFAWVRDRFGPPDAALLPIGAYEPRWFMSPVHMAPDEALRAHEILQSRLSIAIHHGTFQLADESIDDPGKQLLAMGSDSFRLLRNGEFTEIA